MKNLFFLVLFIVLFTFFSCERTKKTFNREFHLQIVNNTNIPTTLSFYLEEDSTTALKEYFVGAHKTIKADTTIYLVMHEIGESFKLLEGEQVNSGGTNGTSLIWNYHSTIMKYNFDNYKESIYHKTKIMYCDTSTLNPLFLCNFTTNVYNDGTSTQNPKEKIQIYTMTYYITNQQYLLADSL